MAIRLKPQKTVATSAAGSVDLLGLKRFHQAKRSPVVRRGSANLAHRWLRSYRCTILPGLAHFLGGAVGHLTRRHVV